MMWMLLLGALPVDPVGDPLPRYLTSVQVIQELGTLTQPFQGCVSEGGHTVALSFSIHGDGSVRTPVWGAAPSHIQTCWGTVLEKLRFPVHDDVPIRVQTTVYVRNGVVTLSPQPTVYARKLGPLMMFVLPQNVDAVSGYLHDASDSEDER